MAGYLHLDFAVGGHEQQHRDLAYFVEAWFDRWLLGDPSAEDRLLADTVLGRPTASLLSHQVPLRRLPAAASRHPRLPRRPQRHQRPEHAKQHGPKRRISKRRARDGLQFRFASDDPQAGFECRLDEGSYKPCESPKRTQNAKLGDHVFRVRATDARGNVEPKPARWRYEISD